MESKGVAESIEWANGVLAAARPIRYGSALWAAQHYGSRAVVACIDGNEDLAVACARLAAGAAHDAVPELGE